ncbi:MAG: 50S ribosomal protein L17 [Dehalococcoidia bacterium]|nr:50S ribosomal protein L17 [Dehalococcoidia bacterium]
MRHRVSGRHLGRDTAHRTSLYRNLVTDLLRYERITTTEAKAKEIRPMAERIITLARRGDIHARRQAMRVVFDTAVVKKTFDEIGPRMKDRPGGYLRITGLEPRRGDGARMATIELVDLAGAPSTPRPQRVTAAPTARTAAPVVAPAAAATPAAAADEAEPTDEAPVSAEAVVESAELHATETAGAAAAEATEGDSTEEESGASGA